MDKVDMAFSCPFCNHGSSVECRIDMKNLTGEANCQICQESFSTTANGGSDESDGRRRQLSFSMACCSSRERALKVRRRYRRTERREKRKGRGVAALTVNLRLRRSPARGGAWHRREPTGWRQRRPLRELGRLDAFGSQAKGYAY